MQDATLICIYKGIQQIIIQSSSQLVVNFIIEKIEVPNDIINLVEDTNVCFSVLGRVE